MRKSIVFLLTLLATAVPLLLYGLRYHKVAALYMFAGDTFYYLDVARHSVGFHGFSFDGQYVTNGFHPLWEWLLVASAKIGLVNYANGPAAVEHVYWLDLALLSAGTATFSVAATRYLRRPALALFTLTPGAVSLLTSVLGAGFFSAWFFLNGMESALALFCFAIGFLLLSSPTLGTQRLLAGSLWMGLALLARLDDVFIAAAILGFILWRAPREKRLQVALPVSLAFVMLCAYMLYNRVSVGTFLPISGATKAGLAVGENTKLLLKLFLPAVTGDKPVALLTRKPVYNGFLEVGNRILQMVLPFAICLVEVVATIRKQEGKRASLLSAACVGVILKALYNFFFVACFAQGSWYYTVSIAIANLVVLVWIDRLVTQVARDGHFPSTFREQAVVVTAYALLALLTANVFLADRNSSDRSPLLQLQDDNSAALKKLADLRGDRFLEFADGIVSYSLNKPGAAGLGLALDAEASHAARQGRFLELMYRRGYRVAIADRTYTGMVDDAVTSAASGHPINLAEIKPLEFQSFQLQTAGDDGSPDGLTFYRIVPVNHRPAKAR